MGWVRQVRGGVSTIGLCAITDARSPICTLKKLKPRPPRMKERQQQEVFASPTNLITTPDHTPSRHTGSVTTQQQQYFSRCARVFARCGLLAAPPCHPRLYSHACCLFTPLACVCRISSKHASSGEEAGDSDNMHQQQCQRQQTASTSLPASLQLSQALSSCKVRAMGVLWVCGVVGNGLPQQTQPAFSRSSVVLRRSSSAVPQKARRAKRSWVTGGA